MKKVILLTLAALVLCVSFASCSDDPLVAPTKVYIVNVEGADDSQLINGLRVVNINKGDTVQLDAITNRTSSLGNVTWISEESSKVSIDPVTGLAVGEAYGASLVKVRTSTGSEVAAAYVNVLMPEVEDELGTVHANIMGFETGSINVSGNTYTVTAPDYATLMDGNHTITLSYNKDPRCTYTGVYNWTVNGFVQPAHGDTITLSFVDGFGTYNVACATETVSYDGTHFPAVHTLQVRVLPE